MDKLLKILGTIYDTKKRMKAVLGTQSDDICEYPTLIHNYFVDAYNEYYPEGYETGYNDAWTQILGTQPLVPPTTPEQRQKQEYTPNIPTVTEYRDQRLADNLSVIMEEVYQARLGMKEELGTDSDLFVTYPDLLENMIEEGSEDGFYTQGYLDGYDDAILVISGTTLNPPTITEENGVITITSDYPAATIKYQIDDGIIQNYTQPFSVGLQPGESATIYAWVEAGSGGQYESEKSRLDINGLQSPDIFIIDNCIFITIDEEIENDGGVIYYSYNNQTFTEYTNRLIIQPGESGTVYAYVTYSNLRSRNSSAAYAYVANAEAHHLMFTVFDDGDILFSQFSSSETVEYNKNDTGWTSISTVTDPILSPASISVNKGDKVKFRGNGFSTNPHLYSNNTRYIISGYITSLYKYNNYLNDNIISNNYEYQSIFSPTLEVNHQLIDATKLILASNTTEGCYEKLFWLCRNLKNAPSVLPATTLAKNCYQNMFWGCNSLISAPSILATVIGDSSCLSMFKDCISLVTAPNLNATTIGEHCYREIFSGCTSLINVQSILPAMTLADYCYFGMFKNCTSLTTAPVLPATVLGIENGYGTYSIAYDQCYGEMFYGCSSLNYIKCLAKDGINNHPNNPFYFTTNWVRNVASNGTFIQRSDVVWPINEVSWTNHGGIPKDWEIIYEQPSN